MKKRDLRRRLMVERLESRLLLAADFGDAPDLGPFTSVGNYSTLQTDNGPSHTIDATQNTLYLGASVDGDSGTLQNASADADDVDNALPDDEDGVLDPLDLRYNVSSQPNVTLLATNTTGNTATLYGWIDYNRDGVFHDATERAQIAVPDGTASGQFTLVFPVVPIDSGSSSYARFRLSTDPAAAHSAGEASDGEVEDYVFTISPPQDYGDAPVPYPTTHSEDGARHIPTELTLGTARDAEADGIHSTAADADDTTGSLDDEDGVTFGPIQVGALDAAVTVNVQGRAGKLDAWIDFNGDGNWGGPDEQIFDSRDVTVGNNNLTFHVPSWAISGTTYARFRLSTTGNQGIGGLADDGEVEDYQITIVSGASSGNFKAQRVVSTNAFGASDVFAADVDGDGDTDILSASKNDDKIAWYENNGNQSFVTHTITTTADDAYRVFAADVDGDGDMDVLSASREDDKIAWYENDGNQNFTTHTITTSANSASDVLAADVDGDGDMDVLSASRDDDKIAWYENDGNQNFTPHDVTVPDVDGTPDHGQDGETNGPRSLSAADVDRDGDLDLVSASRNDDKIAWYENDGNQNFISHTITTAAMQAYSVFAADVDGDGDIDALSASIYKIAWYENDGNQNFTTHTITTKVNFARGVYAADVDGDGDMDVLSASSTGPRISWYENDGSQNFEMHIVSREPIFPSSVFVADVDGDGDVDILSTSLSRNTIAWHEQIDTTLQLSASSIFEVEDGSGNASITFTRSGPGVLTIDFAVAGSATFGVDYTQSGATAFDTDSGRVTMAEGVDQMTITLSPLADTDVELDETIELTVAEDPGYTIIAGDAIELTIVDDEPGDFGDAPIPYLVTLSRHGAKHGVVGPRLGTNRDAESDGQPSLAATGDNLNGSNDEDGVTFGNIQVGALDASLSVQVQQAAGKLDAWIDFNGDGSWGGPGEQIFASHPVTVGDNHLKFDVPSWAIAGTTFSRFRLSTLGGLGVKGAAADGEVEDYLVTIVGPDSSSGVFGPQNVISTDVDYANSVFAADLDGDGDLDILSSSSRDNAIRWYENDGSQAFANHTITTTADSAQSVVAVDLDGDGDQDVLSASGGSDTITWHENDGSQNFTHHTVTTTADFVNGILAVDVNGDGHLDILSSSNHDDKVAWYQNDGDQNFTTHTISTMAYQAQSVFAADMDGDGDLDVLGGSESAIVWYENDGSQEFATRTIGNVSLGANSIFAADIDGDGDLDVVSGRPNNLTVDWYENDGSQNFTPRQVSADARAESLTVADMDGDGNLDLLAALVLGDAITWYENDGSQDFATHIISTSVRFSLSVFPADVDGDGDLDVLIASAGDDKIAWYENDPIPTVPDAVGIFRSSQSRWFQGVSGNGTVDNAVNFGASGDVPLVGDWDGDGVEDIGIHRANEARIALDTGSDGTTDRSFTLGAAGMDTVLVGDFNGDQRDDLLIYRASQARFYFDLDADGDIDRSHTLGAANIDTVLVGDFDGDNTDDVLIYRAGQAKFFFDFSANGSVDRSFTLGTVNIDTVLVGDFDGDENDDIAIHRAGQARFFIDLDADGTVDRSFHLGATNIDLALAGDINGDGTDDIVIHRASQTSFYIDLDANGTVDNSFHLGANSDTAIIGAWGNPLLAFGGVNLFTKNVEDLTPDDLAPITDAAINIWAGTGLNTEQLEKLRATAVSIGNLPGSQLGATLQTAIVIDASAAGYGWFVDVTPQRNEEFVDPGDESLSALASSAALGRMDLLTVVLHELGHVLGLDDGHSGGLMHQTLSVGIRRRPG